MGRIKTAQIKRITGNLLEKHPGKFKDSFEENKKLVEEFAEIETKKIRNIIAGYITRLVKAKKEANQRAAELLIENKKQRGD